VAGAGGCGVGCMLWPGCLVGVVLLSDPIVKQGVRILRPCEATALIDTIPKHHHGVMFKALLYSGMRYVEMQRLQEHPEWLTGSFIHLPEVATKQGRKKSRDGRQTRSQVERWVRLNPVGLEVIKQYLKLGEQLPGRYQSWRDNLVRWAEHAGIGSEGMSVKTTRKTWESWLITVYKAHVPDVLLSQGHTYEVALQSYWGLPFTETDKGEMLAYVGQWVGGPLKEGGAE